MLRLFLGFIWIVGTAVGAGVGFDSMSATQVVKIFQGVPAEIGRTASADDNLLRNGQGRWLRLRMNFSAGKLDDVDYVASERAAMETLKKGGWKLCAIVEYGAKDWKSGTRREQRLPLDLREIYQRGLRLKAAYGDLIDAFEIGNEPDITFVPENAETYAAYLKAAWTALAAEPRGRWAMGDGREGGRGVCDAGRDGAGCRAAACLQPLSSARGIGRAGEKDLGHGAQPGSTQGRALQVQGAPLGAESDKDSGLSPRCVAPSAPIAHRLSPLARGQEPSALVLMAPLSLPPGPWLELFIKNDGLGYTDGFNYHMYGYAGDFEGMYAAFERALAPAQTPQARGEGREAKGGSVVAEQRDEGDEGRGGALASARTPQARGEGRGARGGSVVAEQRDEGDAGRGGALASAQTPQARGEGLGAEPVDQTWEAGIASVAGGAKLRRLGEIPPGSSVPGYNEAVSGLSPLASCLLPPPKAPGAFGAWLMSPALEYLLYSPEARWGRTRSWQVDVPAPSPVVIDHVVVEKVHAMKRYLSYMVENEGTSDTCVGQAVVVVYNFSDRTVRGTLKMPREARAYAATEAQAANCRAAACLQPFAQSEVSVGLVRKFQPGSTQGRALQEKGLAKGLAFFPVFITEFGYAQLSGKAAKTAEGRERQRLWFEEVTRQARDLKIEGMMAFALGPYLETSAYEFGLAMDVPKEAQPAQAPPMGKQDTAKVVSVPKPADLSAQRERHAGPFTESEIALTLEPGARVEIPVEYRFQARSFDPQPISYLFEAEDASVPPARWVSNLLPDPKGMKLVERARLDGLSARGKTNAERLKALPLVREEGERRASGPAWVTGDVTVQATPEGWRFTVASMDESLFYPINVELPWPAGVPFEEKTLLRFLYRLVDEREPSRIEQLDFYVRTANGNLYQVYPRLFAGKDWQGYIEHRDNFTLTYYGRSNLPWRFAENEPIGLVFRLRPRKVPATFEVRDLGLIRYERDR